MRCLTLSLSNSSNNALTLMSSNTLTLSLQKPRKMNVKQLFHATLGLWILWAVMFVSTCKWLQWVVDGSVNHAWSCSVAPAYCRRMLRWMQRRRWPRHERWRTRDYAIERRFIPQIFSWKRFSTFQIWTCNNTVAASEKASTLWTVRSVLCECNEAQQTFWTVMKRAHFMTVIDGVFCVGRACYKQTRFNRHASLEWDYNTSDSVAKDRRTK